MALRLIDKKQAALVLIEFQNEWLSADGVLRQRLLNTPFFMEFATHGCVESSLREAHDPGYNAYVVEDACAAVEQTQHEHVRKHMVRHFGLETYSTELISFLEQ